MSDNPGALRQLAFQAKLDETIFEARQIFLFGEINQGVARDVSEKLVAMSAIADRPITLIINSQGGHVEAADTIYDMIDFVAAPVQVLGTGWVASAGAHIFLAPPRERRFALPNTRFMLHQPAGGAHGQAVDIGIEAREIVKMRKRLNEVIAERTGQPLEKVEKDTDRNFWMSAEEARDYGIVGKVVRRASELG
jgi:ATP-dependent Clp protease protease subunit